ncbi:pyrimidine/purine nucleotide monophosphate nucleosidase domain-containing protein [Shigella flexneri]
MHQICKCRLSSLTNMANLKLYRDQPVEVLAADLRRAFSGIVAGNLKEVGIRTIEEFGPYKINGDKEIMRRMDDLLGVLLPGIV